jgi:hypothetical protein
MQLITAAQRQKLLENGRAQRVALDQKTGAIDFEPVVKLSSSRSGYSMPCDRVSPSMYRLIGYPISPDELILCPDVSSSFRTASADCCHHRDWKVIRSCGLVTTVTNIPLWGTNL